LILGKLALMRIKVSILEDEDNNEEDDEGIFEDQANMLLFIHALFKENNEKK
jgi:hypothetical protein